MFRSSSPRAWRSYGSISSVDPHCIITLGSEIYGGHVGDQQTDGSIVQFYSMVGGSPRRAQFDAPSYILQEPRYADVVIYMGSWPVKVNYLDMSSRYKK